MGLIFKKNIYGILWISPFEIPVNFSVWSRLYFTVKRSKPNRQQKFQRKTDGSFYTILVHKRMIFIDLTGFWANSSRCSSLKINSYYLNFEIMILIKGSLLCSSTVLNHNCICIFKYYTTIYILL